MFAKYPKSHFALSFNVVIPKGNHFEEKLIDKGLTYSLKSEYIEIEEDSINIDIIKVDNLELTPKEFKTRTDFIYTEFKNKIDKLENSMSKIEEKLDLFIESNKKKKWL